VVWKNICYSSATSACTRAGLSFLCVRPRFGPPSIHPPRRVLLVATLSPLPDRACATPFTRRCVVFRARDCARRIVRAGGWRPARDLPPAQPGYQPVLTELGFQSLQHGRESHTISPCVWLRDCPSTSCYTRLRTRLHYLSLQASWACTTSEFRTWANSHATIDAFLARWPTRVGAAREAARVKDRGRLRSCRAFSVDAVEFIAGVRR